ncbi:MAG: hypothetical protein D6690_12720 [Nitrospirae bacterium]|nr:MAG: hypothetical protein D6690_12720 [Nitrospirota bacterium]
MTVDRDPLYQTALSYIRNIQERSIEEKANDLIYWSTKRICTGPIARSRFPFPEIPRIETMTHAADLSEPELAPNSLSSESGALPCASATGMEDEDPFSTLLS